MTSQFYTPTEASLRYNVPYSTFLQLARNGELEHLRPVKIGKHWRFPKKIIDADADGTEV